MSAEGAPQLVCFDYAETDLTSKIRAMLQGHAGFCLVQNMPCCEDNQTLEGLALALGTPLLEPHNIGGGMTCAVALEPENQVPAYANTPYAFSGHTDCSDFSAPPDTVLLLCEAPAESGGESLISLLSHVLPLLSLNTLLGLQQARFLFRNAFFPVLSQKRGQSIIRYNRIMMDIYRQAHDLPRETDLEHWLDELDQAIASVQHCFALKKSDCLILNNQTTLHGRLSFQGPQRLLKRVRLNLKDT